MNDFEIITNEGITAEKTLFLSDRRKYDTFSIERDKDKELEIEFYQKYAECGFHILHCSIDEARKMRDWLNEFLDK